MEELLRRIGKLEENLSQISARVSALESSGRELALVGVRGEIKRELAAYHVEISRAMEGIAEEATKEATNTVLTVVDRKILPMINKTIEWVGYNTQDGGAVVDDYRRNVVSGLGGGKKFGHITRVFED